MKRQLRWVLGAACVAAGLGWVIPGAVRSQEPAKPSEPAIVKPATVRVEQGKLVVESSLKGVLEAEQSAELAIEPKSWTGPFSVKSAVAHGTRVKKGDLLLELDTTTIDKTLRDLKLDRELADIALRVAKEELPVLEQFLPLNLATAERDKRIAEEDLKRYETIDRAQTMKSAAFSLKSMGNFLEYAREELKQLEKMYRDKDLTEETEEIILKRQRNQIESLEHNLESTKIQTDRSLNVDVPRRDQSVKDTLLKQTLAWQKAQSVLPLELNQKRLALQKQQVEREKTEERFTQLEGDRKAMVVVAPIDGILYHGQCDRGNWNTATVSARLRRNGNVLANEVFMTVVTPRPLVARADVEEKDLHAIKADVAGELTPVGFPDLKLAARVKSVSLVPRAAGTFESRLTVDVPADVESLMPGMTGTVKLTTYRNDKATLVPSTAVFRDEGSSASHVYLVIEGKPIKTEITIGKASLGKTEVLKGLKVGDELLANKP
ncbi:MAG: hypothetical protein AABP62_18610 [Planctomycetota bacterium]